MKLAVMAGVAAAALAANARTIAWWHLDELEIGTTVTNQAPFLNAVDPTKHAGLSRATPLDGGTWRVNSVWLPKGAQAFPDGACWYDPVSGAKAENSRGLEFRPALKDSYEEGKKDNRVTGPVVVIPGSEELCPESFTYEFFFKFTPTGVDKRIQYLVFNRATVNDGTDNVGLRIYLTYGANGSKMGATFSTQAAAGGSATSVTYETGWLKSLNNDKWHHVAVTFDGASLIGRFYVDYSYIGSMTLKVAPKSTQDIALGNSNAGWGAFEGYIDEFRISDRALAPGEFLQVIDEGVPQMYPETAVYQRFSQWPEFFGTKLDTDTYDASLLRNEAPAATTIGAPIVAVYGDGYRATAEVPVANVSTGAVGRADGIANRTAVALRSTEASRDPSNWSKSDLPKSVPCWKFTDTNAAVSTNDVTAEMFFRMTNIAYSSYFFCMGQPAWRVVANSDGTINVNNTTVYKQSVADGKWHHLAFVADGKTKKGKLYLDYALCTDTSASGEVSIGPGEPQGAIGIGCYGNDTLVTFYDIDMDDIRITRRKLSVEEFLHENRNDGVIVDHNFDQQDDLRHDWMEQVTQVNEKNGGGSTTRTYDTTDKPGEKVADGLFATQAANVSSCQVVGGSGRDGCYYTLVKGGEIASLPAGSFTVEYEAKFPENAYEDYWDNAAYMVFHRNAANGSPAWQISFVPKLGWNSTAKQPSTENANAGMLKFATGYSEFATSPATAWADGTWHHFAFVYDKEAGEIRAYLDHALLGTKETVLDEAAFDELYFGTGGWAYTLGMHTWGFDNFRITKKALAPKDFKTSKFLTGNTLVWATFDRSGGIISELGLTAAFTGSAWCGGAGQVTDAEEQPLAARGRNRGAVALEDGAAAYGRLSLLEIPDFTAEFFVRGAASAAAGTDLVGLMGADGATPIWSVRKGADGQLHVMATPQGGTLTDLGAIGAAEAGWTHVAVTFEPTADGAETKVRAYVGHALAGEEMTLAGTLAVKDISSSALTCGQFAGAVDELRISKGTLAAADMLYATPIGFLLLLK